MENKKTLYADLALLFVAIIWGSGFVFTKNALDHITPFYIMGFRFLVGTIAITLISIRRLRRITKLDIKAGLIVGFFMFLGFAAQTVGLKYTTVGVQAFITASNVVMVPFFYWILSKKKPDNFEILGAILCFVGIGILSLDSNLHIGNGEFLTFLCAIGFALQIVAVGYFANDVDPYILSVVQLSLATILSFICAFIFEPKITTFNSDMIFPILFLGIFSTFIAFLIQNIAQAHTSSTHAAIILSLEAVFGSVIAIIVLKEPITIKFIIGCLAIFLSVIASETKLGFIKQNEKRIHN